ncbi:hypothetical protein WJX79_005286 [Trebouxia sp. C0005]
MHFSLNRWSHQSCRHICVLLVTEDFIYLRDLVHRLPGVTIGRGLGFEIVLTFVFVFTVMAATDSVQTTSTISLKVLAPLAIGLILFVCHLVAIPVDGYCVNPARGFGPAVVSRTFHRYWIFWVGPLTGAAVAAFIYQTVFKVRMTSDLDPHKPHLCIITSCAHQWAIGMCFHSQQSQKRVCVGRRKWVGGQAHQRKKPEDSAQGPSLVDVEAQRGNSVEAGKPVTR